MERRARHYAFGICYRWAIIRRTLGRHAIFVHVSIHGRLAALRGGRRRTLRFGPNHGMCRCELNNLLREEPIFWAEFTHVRV